MDSLTIWERRFNRRFQGFLERPDSRIEQASLINFPDESNIPNEAHSPSQVGVPFDFLNVAEGWELPIDALRRLPRDLCAMTLLSDMNPVNQGHYEYWRYTGACASVLAGFRSPLHTEEQFEQMFEDTHIDKEQLPDWFTVPLNRIELNDLCLLLHLGLLGLQKHRVQIQQIDPDGSFVSGQTNPSIDKLIEHSFNLTTRYGFPVLEGLAGKWKQEGGKLGNKLVTWTKETRNDTTKASLIEINSLKHIDPGKENEDILDQLYQMVEFGIDDPSKIHAKLQGQSVFSSLADVRGDTQHGDESYSGPAVVVVTLCCLAFWDLLNAQQYRRVREWIEQDINREHDRQERIMRDMGWKPENFYNSATVSLL